MSIETEHRGFKIRYGENSDTWECMPLELSAPTLSALKRKIDIVERKARQTETIPALHVKYAGQVVPVVITAKVGKSSSGRRCYWDAKDGVWCVNQADRTRSKVEVKDLIEDTPDNRARVAIYELLCEEAKAARRRADAALADIPRMTSEAVPAADPETDGGE